MSRKSLLVVASLILSVVIGLFLSRGAGGAEKKGDRRPLIGLSLDTLKEARWQADAELFKQRAAELGADVLVQAANGDDTRQINDVQSLITRNVDA